MLKKLLETLHQMYDNHGDIRIFISYQGGDNYASLVFAGTTSHVVEGEKILVFCDYVPDDILDKIKKQGGSHEKNS
jgi:hypothetical protein